MSTQPWGPQSILKGLFLFSQAHPNIQTNTELRTSHKTHQSMKPTKDGCTTSEDLSSITQLMLCFNTVLMCIVLGSMAMLSQPSPSSRDVPPDDVLQESLTSTSTDTI